MTVPGDVHSIAHRMRTATQRLTGTMKSVVVTIGPPIDIPWWWEEVQADHGLCQLSFKRVVFRNKRSKQIGTIELPFFLIKMLPIYFQLRREYDYMFTFECDLTSFALSFWQTVFFSRKPRHVVLQFIMREKTNSVGSRLKYFLMKWCFRSLHKVICSASTEAEYYREMFGWPVDKSVFVPFHTSNRIVKQQLHRDEGFVIAAGRVFRDFQTLISAVQKSDYKTVIVASKNVVRPPDANNIQVFRDIPVSEFEKLMVGSRLVVVPLEDMRISAGQSVLLHAMALGKPVIATKTTGTIDYIVDGENGLLVEPNNPEALRNAIDLVMSDPALRRRLGSAARQSVLQRHLPHHYTQEIRKVLAQA